MRPGSLSIGYRLAGGESAGSRGSAGGEAPLRCSVFELAAAREGLTCEHGLSEDGERCFELRILRLKRDGGCGETVEIWLDAVRELRLASCGLSLSHEFAADEQVLLNGYQSWTDTFERPAFATMRGLDHVPAPIVRRWALDASGDYRFASYEDAPGRQHGFSYATFRRGGGLTLLASLDESHGFTLIASDAQDGKVTLSTECPARTLRAGESAQLGRYLIAHGTRDEVYDAYAEAAVPGWRAPRPLIGYTSWYRHYGEIDEQALEDDLAGMRAAFDELGLSGGTPAIRLFQVDDGYAKVGDWLDPDPARFPHGMAALAQRIRDAGFVAGLWLAPFVCEQASRLAAEHPEWLLRAVDEPGMPTVATGPQWSGGLALDTRNGELREHVARVLDVVTREWGFGLLKLDFLYAACMLPHDGMNRGELMADAIDLVCESVAPGTLLLGCGVPLASVFGRFDYCRVGCDVGPDWDDKPYMRRLHRERVSTKNSLASTVGRAPLDGRLVGCDPDVFFLRDDVRLTREQRLELLATDAACGHALLTSDDMGSWDESQKAAYREAVAILLERTAR